MSNAKQLEKHNDYYIDGGDLYIVVTHTIFRVHSYFFQRESQRFRDIMAAPVPLGQVRQGQAEHAPIMIKDISVAHFAKVLWVFYNPIYAVYNATLTEWIAILKFAHDFQFAEVKRLAIRELEDLDIPIARRIVLYQNHAVDPLYLVPLYVKLCMRDEGPTDDETETMGMKTSLIIFRARERLRFRPTVAGAKGTPPYDENDITRTIYSLLGFDFNGQPTGTSSSHANQRANKNSKGGSSSKFDS